MLRQPSILSYEDVGHQVIWNNKNITVQKISLFEKHLLSKGIVTIGDLISDTGIFLKGCEGITCKFISDTTFWVNERRGRHSS